MARSNRERLQSVQYLRGLAALAVVWFHFSLGSADGLIKSSGTFGYLGVIVFFVISGFIVPYSLAGRDYRLVRDGPGFFVRRMLRLEPPYLVAVALPVVLLFAAAATPWFKGTVVPPLWFSVAVHPLYLVPWFEGADWVNIVFWTLAIEFQWPTRRIRCYRRFGRGARGQHRSEVMPWRDSSPRRYSLPQPRVQSLMVRTGVE